MGIVVDAVLVVLFVVIVIIGFARGFIKSVLRYAAVVAAFAVALCFCTAVGEYVYDRFMYEKVRITVGEAIDKAIDVGTGETDVDGESESDESIEAGEDKYDIDSELENPESGLALLLKTFGVTEQRAKEYLSRVVGDSLEAKKDVLADRISETVAKTASRVVAFTVVFLGALIVFMLVVLLMQLMAKLPVLKTADSILGGLFGVLCGAMTIYAVSLVLPYVSELFETLDIYDGLLDGARIPAIVSKYNLFGFLTDRLF